MARLIKFANNPDIEKNEAILERNRSLSVKSPKISDSPLKLKVNTDVEIKPLQEFIKSSTEDQPIELR